jgi:hypothetical protein
MGLFLFFTTPYRPNELSVASRAKKNKNVSQKLSCQLILLIMEMTMNELDTKLKPDKRLAAVCGLFCPSCSAFIGTHKDPERLESMAKRMGRGVEELACHGCRSEKRSFFCEKLCKMSPCAKKRGIEFCGACPDYPCGDLKQFQAQMPHRAELWQALQRIQEVGYEQWFSEMTIHYSCPHCGVINSIYDEKCRKCATVPSSRYFELHRDEILRHPALAKMSSTK